MTNKIVRWVEPWPGMAADGSKVGANVEVRATAADCVAMSRHNLTKLKALKGGETDEFLLEQFVTVNWATIEESIPSEPSPWWRRLLAWWTRPRWFLWQVALGIVVVASWAVALNTAGGVSGVCACITIVAFVAFAVSTS